MDRRALAERFGTPLYVYDLDRVAAAARALRASLPARATLFYSLKANPHPAVATALRHQGCRAEVSSVGELEAAVAAGFAAGACLYTGPGKTAPEIEQAMAAGVTDFSAESLVDLARIGAAATRLGATARCLLRVNGTSSPATAGLRMTGAPSQFGFDLAEVPAWREAVDAVPGATVIGVHLFTMTNAHDEDSLIGELTHNIATAARLRDEHGLRAHLLDLGGGFASPYAVPGGRPSYPRLRASLERRLDAHFPAWRSGDPEVAFESGRYLVAGCGELVTTVMDVKQSKGRTFVVLDSGMNHVGGVGGPQRLLKVRARPPGDDDPGSDDGRDDARPITLVGPLCTPLDVLARDTRLVQPAVGDTLVIPNVGAYGLTASLIGFLGRPAPVEVALRGGEVVSASALALARRELAAPAAERSAGEVAARRAPRAGSASYREPAAVDLARSVLPVLRQHAAVVDEKACFPAESMAALRASGLMGLQVPRRYGGMGGGLGDLVAVASVLASGCLSTAMIWGMHCQQVDALVRFGSPELKASALPRIAAGDVYVGSITSERRTGGHLLTSAPPLIHDQDGLSIRRDAPVVTGGTHCDAFLVTMRASASAPAHEVTLVYADRRQVDVEVTGGWDALGMRGTHSVGLRLTGKVPRSQVVGEPGRFRDVALESFIPVGHIAWSACWLGAAREGLSSLVQRLRSSSRPGGADPRSELVTERLAGARMDLEAVSAYLHETEREVSRHRAEGGPLSSTATQIHLNTLKVLASDLTYRAVDRCVQLAGLSLGYRKDSPIPLERHLRDLRSASLNYANDRLMTATGTLCLLDRAATLLGSPPDHAAAVPVPVPGMPSAPSPSSEEETSGERVER